MPTVKLELDEQHLGNFKLFQNNQKAGEMEVRINGENITVYHTEVAPEYEGKGYGKLLLDALVAEARQRNLFIIPLCSFVYVQFKRHPQAYADVWVKQTR